MKIKIKDLDDNFLLLNLYLTQGVVLLLGCIGTYFLFIRNGVSFSSLFVTRGSVGLFWSVGIAFVIILVNILFTIWFPREFFDDGGINEKLFLQRPVLHIFVICLFVSFSEELLFRLVIQSVIGLWLTSLLFAFIHIRYLRKKLMFITVFGVGLVIGWLYDESMSLTTVTLCHFLVDFILALLIRFGLEERSRNIKEDVKPE